MDIVGFTRFKSKEQRTRLHQTVKDKKWRSTNQMILEMADEPDLVPKKPLKTIN
jgi:hypothetical protein